MARRTGANSVSSRESLLDVAERLLGERGYAATPVSAVCREAGVAVTSLYWHFGSKEGLLASVMERGAQRWFAALPRWAEIEGDADTRAEVIARSGAAAVGGHPLFLRLYYLLALEKPEDEVVAELIGRVRQRARDYFREAIVGMLAGSAEPAIVAAVGDDLATFAVAFSDGCFLASQLEPAGVDLDQSYRHLLTALRALAPTAMDRAQRAHESTRERQ